MEELKIPNPAQFGKTSIGIESNLAAAVGYPIGLVSIILLCTERGNRFVKFHAFQSILLHIGLGVFLGAFGFLLMAVVLIVGDTEHSTGSAATNVVWAVSILIWGLFPLFFLGVVIVSAVKAYSGAEFKLPVIGKFATQLASKWAG